MKKIKKILATIIAFAALTTVFATAPSVPASALTEAQGYAAQLINSGRVTGNTEPMAQLRSYANGTVYSHVINGSTRSCTIDKVLLRVVKTLVVDRGFRIRITSLNRYCIDQQTASGTSSYHYRNGGGQAIDIAQVNGVTVTKTGSKTHEIAFVKAFLAVTPTPAGLGQKSCNRPAIAIPPGVAYFDDTCDHIHIEYRGATPSYAGGYRYPLESEFTNDNNSDLVARKSDGSLRLYPSNGTGGFKASSTIGGGWNVMNHIVSRGDFSGDGRSDIIARKTDGTLWLYKGNGAVGFAATQIGIGWNIFTMIVNAGDLTNDGASDLVARKADGTLMVYPGNGTGGFKTPSAIAGGWNVFNSIIAPGDFNGDGANDLITRKSDGTLWLYKGNGNLAFAPSLIGSGWNIFTSILTVGDFSGDGKPDVLGIKRDNSLWNYPGNGTGWFKPQAQIGTGWAFTWVA